MRTQTLRPRYIVTASWLLAPLLAVALVGCDNKVDETPVTPATPVAPTPDVSEPAEPVVSTPATDSPTPTTESESVEAVCVLEPIGGSKVKGTVRFTQQGDKVHIHGEVTGLTPGLHGFHIHEKGDLSDKEKGLSAGGHYDPDGQPHGKQTDEKRHVGDLGNIDVSEEGVATIDIEDSVISLEGDHSIVGRALVIHAGEDLFTQPSGDAGDRVAFGRIEKE